MATAPVTARRVWQPGMAKGWLESVMSRLGAPTLCPIRPSKHSCHILYRACLVSPRIVYVSSLYLQRNIFCSHKPTVSPSFVVQLHSLVCLSGQHDYFMLLLNRMACYSIIYIQILSWALRSRWFDRGIEQYRLILLPVTSLTLVAAINTLWSQVIIACMVQLGRYIWTCKTPGNARCRYHQNLYII